MRTEPSTSSPILTTIPKGSQVVAVGSRGAWRSVQYRGRAGWVSSRYVSRERPVLTSAPRPPAPVTQRRAVRAIPENSPAKANRCGRGHTVKAATVHMTECVMVVGAAATVHGVGPVEGAPSVIGSRGADSRLGAA
ncbi:SH3 domain-containing protein [Nitratireductor aquibiodomus]|uniref:SH3 domain-containing protein n=1 Tax=Nitratireductor aquibiodomus TaxID=204799 RepID=UPI003A5C5C0D